MQRTKTAKNKMNALFGAKITQTKIEGGVSTHIIIPEHSMNLGQKDALFSSLPINTGHLIMAGKNLEFLLALITQDQKKVIQTNRSIKYVGEVNLDIEALTLLLEDGMSFLSSENISNKG